MSIRYVTYVCVSICIRDNTPITNASAFHIRFKLKRLVLLPSLDPAMALLLIRGSEEKGRKECCYFYFCLLPGAPSVTISLYAHRAQTGGFSSRHGQLILWMLCSLNADHAVLYNPYYQNRLEFTVVRTVHTEFHSGRPPLQSANDRTENPGCDVLASDLPCS